MDPRVDTGTQQSVVPTTSRMGQQLPFGATQHPRHLPKKTNRPEDSVYDHPMPTPVRAIECLGKALQDQFAAHNDTRLRLEGEFSRRVAAEAAIYREQQRSAQCQEMFDAAQTQVHKLQLKLRAQEAEFNHLRLRVERAMGQHDLGEAQLESNARLLDEFSIFRHQLDSLEKNLLNSNDTSEGVKVKTEPINND